MKGLAFTSRESYNTLQGSPCHTRGALHFHVVLIYTILLRKRKRRDRGITYTSISILQQPTRLARGFCNVVLLQYIYHFDEKRDEDNLRVFVVCSVKLTKSWRLYMSDIHLQKFLVSQEKPIIPQKWNNFIASIKGTKRNGRSYYEAKLMSFLKNTNQGISFAIGFMVLHLPMNAFSSLACPPKLAKGVILSFSKIR